MIKESIAEVDGAVVGTLEERARSLKPQVIRLLRSIPEGKSLSSRLLGLADENNDAITTPIVAEKSWGKSFEKRVPFNNTFGNAYPPK